MIDQVMNHIQGMQDRIEGQQIRKALPGARRDDALRKSKLFNTAVMPQSRVNFQVIALAHGSQRQQVVPTLAINGKTIIAGSQHSQECIRLIGGKQ
ncbi:MAG: hypothetical protein BWY63_01771 [Chloroflexi bacterium ADurb.Bin360]|nr:MAG: hypothetical protein BWY63_01771 [Chloroflexi bacterium ADurb.Bin360]